MKKILLIALIAAFTFSACDDESSRDISYVTTYAVLTPNGDADLFWQKNTPFVDPGCVAFEGETDITDQITVKSNVDVTKYGKYAVTYSAVNSDGFAASFTRNVYVCDKTASLNGVYTSNIVRDNDGTVGKRGPYSVIIYGIDGGQYWISDLIGGWYDFGSGYGSTYAGSAIIKINPDNTISIVSADPMAWGYPCELTSGTTSTYDPSTKTLVLNTNMEDAPTMKFTVTLTKN